MTRTLTPWVLSIAFAAMAFALGWSLGRSGTASDSAAAAAQPSQTTIGLERERNRESYKYLLSNSAESLREGKPRDPLKMAEFRVTVSKFRDGALSCMTQQEIDAILPVSLLEQK